MSKTTKLKKHINKISKIKSQSQFLKEIEINKLISEDMRQASHIFGLYCDQVILAIEEYIDPIDIGSGKLFYKVVPHISYYYLVKDNNWNEALFLGVEDFINSKKGKELIKTHKISHVKF